MPETIYDRKLWVDILVKISTPVLEALAERRLKISMPVEGRHDRRQFSHLEALARTLVGVSPWLECCNLHGEEEELRQKFSVLAREAIDAATDPGSPDCVNFTFGDQPIVDAAFLAHAILRAPNELWLKLDDRVKTNLVTALKATRTRKPYYNNWLLFAAMIETAFFKIGEAWDRMRVDYALKQHEQWYLGDGVYGDGPEFRWDYYNSFVIQPMLVDIILTVGDEYEEWEALKRNILKRAQRYAAIQERMISPEGTFPVIGRSMAYRCGAFQHLAQMALQKNLPDEVSPSQVRCALTAVINRIFSVPGTFDQDGWLKIGFCGSQPDMGETYISTGSLYLCMGAFLPLGLPPEDEFWSDAPSEWTSQKIWSGQNVKSDHAL
ncbi:MAG: hypothetical protein JG777_11 [Clostridia bacterium]|nr:hypothetical protein [Clostridia bacterium]